MTETTIATLHVQVSVHGRNIGIVFLRVLRVYNSGTSHSIFVQKRHASTTIVFSDASFATQPPRQEVSTESSSA